MDSQTEGLVSVSASQVRSRLTWPVCCRCSRDDSSDSEHGGRGQTRPSPTAAAVPAASSRDGRHERLNPARPSLAAAATTTAATTVSRPRQSAGVGRDDSVDSLRSTAGACVLRSARRCPLRGLTAAAAAAALPCQPPPAVPTSVRRARTPQTDPRDMRVVCASEVTTL